ncbi:hypothetical protein [Streptomyces sp. Wh19]|uniref:Uncharacterized protein n=1 Tax=Streptomyces sanglieri TaxID=193460 RepID=A0ABW2X8F3_9ACTN|nr:hypothetical protein [Streptomyces sp. Wh19]MDV9194560.1 hypothetical protein [Streptomyces sp. Wh19]
MAQRVGAQSGQSTGEESGVGDHVGQLFRQAQNDRVAAGSEVVQCGGQHLVEVDRVEVEVERPGVQTTHIVEISDQLRRTVHRRAGGLQQLCLLRDGRGGASTPQAFECFFGRVQRSTQIASSREKQGCPGTFGVGEGVCAVGTPGD